jgi:hypothetical protein
MRTTALLKLCSGNTFRRRCKGTREDRDQRPSEGGVCGAGDRGTSGCVSGGGGGGDLVVMVVVVIWW